jgi:hypothetical protein
MIAVNQLFGIHSGTPVDCLEFPSATMHAGHQIDAEARPESHLLNDV